MFLVESDGGETNAGAGAVPAAYVTGAVCGGLLGYGAASGELL